MAIRYRQKTSSLRGRLEQGSNPARMPQLVRILCRSSSNGQEHPSLKRDDVGSHPTGGTNPAHVAQSLAEARGSDPRQCGFESLREYQFADGPTRDRYPSTRRVMSSGIIRPSWGCSSDGRAPAPNVAHAVEDAWRKAGDVGSKPTICSVTHTLSVSAFGSVAQIWRAPALQAGGCGCDACQIHHGPSSSRLRTAASQAANRGSKPRGPTNAGRGWCPGRAHTLVLEGSIPSSATSSWHAALRREDYPEPVRPCKAPACPLRVWQRGR